MEKEKVSNIDKYRAELIEFINKDLEKSSIKFLEYLCGFINTGKEIWDK